MISAEIERKILELYAQGCTYQKICQLCNVGSGTVTRVLHRNNCPRVRADKKNISKLYKEQIIEMYFSGASLEAIKNKIGCSDTLIFRTIKKNGHSLNRGYGITRLHHIEHQNYFEKIDTEDKAYFLGWIISDGCVKKSGEGIEICLAQKDEHILNAFRKYIGTDKPIESVIGTGYSKGATYSRLSIFSKKIVQDLALLGVHPNKSKTISYPRGIKGVNIHRSLIRGIFDGDGTVSMSKQGKSRVFMLVGTLYLLDEIAGVFSKFCGLPDKTAKATKSEYFLHYLAYYHKNHLSTIYDFLYKSTHADLLLNRKKERFEQVLSTYEN